MAPAVVIFRAPPSVVYVVELPSDPSKHQRLVRRVGVGRGGEVECEDALSGETFWLRSSALRRAS